MTEVSKKCGPPEEPELHYKEGCDFIDVPYKQQLCYCRTHLCNEAAKIEINFIIIGLFLSMIVQRMIKDY